MSNWAHFHGGPMLPKAGGFRDAMFRFLGIQSSTITRGKRQTGIVTPGDVVSIHGPGLITYATASPLPPISLLPPSVRLAGKDWRSPNHDRD